MYSSSQRRILGELGVELWVRRARSVAAVAEPAVGLGDDLTAARSLPAPSGDTGRTAAPTGGATESPFSLELVGLRAAGVLVIGELPLAADRRFARDVLAAVAGMPSLEPEAVPFGWPQSSRGDQGREAAGQALEAFLRGQVQREEVRTLVIFGEVPRELLFPRIEEGNRVVQFAGVAGVLTGTTEALRSSAARKRELWHTLLTVPTVPTA